MDNAGPNDVDREFAFYYPNPYWCDHDWVKNLLLFFDGIAMLIPEGSPDHSGFEDEAIIEGLKQYGLFEVIRPEKTVDATAAKQLGDALIQVIDSGCLDGLAATPFSYAILSASRLGFFGDREIAQLVLQKLEARGLAKYGEDANTIDMHPLVRTLVLVLLSQILRQCGQDKRLTLSPATDRPELITNLESLLNLPQVPTVGNVVSFDLKAVGIDLASEPIGEILDFRKEHGAKFRRYAFCIRQFVRELSEMPEGDREDAYAERQCQLDEIAEGLRQHSGKAWKGPVSFLLGLTGAAWAAYSGNVLGGLLAGAGVLLRGTGMQPPDAGAYSYLFARRQTRQN